MNIIVKCLTIILILNKFNNAQSNFTRLATPCMTARGKEGVCIEHQACPFLLNIMNSNECQEYVNTSKCGPKNEDQEIFRVCCPLNKDECGSANGSPTSNVCCRIGKQEQPPLGIPNIPNIIQTTTFKPPISYDHPTTEAIPINSCGIQSPIVENRVFGGEMAQIGEFPWLAILKHRNEYGNLQSGCVGFLISQYHVLTAAHCVKSAALKAFGPISQVTLGEHNTETSIDCTSNNIFCADPIVTVQTDTPIVHEDYDPTSDNHIDDIAVIPLKHKVNFTNYVRPICLINKPSNQKVMWVSGWGRTETDVNSNVKLRVAVSARNFTECQQIYDRINVKITEKQICAGNEGKDSCRGDSGGPLMVKDLDNVWYAEGIVSFGFVCGKQEWPAVYTHLPSYADWISNILQNDKRSKE